MNTATRLAKSTHGTASVEVVVMLPVFIVLFAGVFYLHGLVAAAENAGSASRACAWAHALAGCPEASPALCENVEIADPAKIDAGAHRPEGGWLDRIKDWPVLGRAVKSVFGSGVVITASQSAPGLMRGASVTLARSNFVLCNTRAQTWTQHLKHLFDFVTGQKKQKTVAASAANDREG